MKEKERGLRPYERQTDRKKTKIDRQIYREKENKKRDKK